MKHLVRAAILLGILVLVAIVLPRVLPLSKVTSLEAFGFYGGKDNTAEIKQLPVSYADPIRCNDCHADKHATWSNSVHQTVSCENCHGPAENHIDEGVSLSINSTSSLCANCHFKLAARPAGFPQVDFSTHGNGENCISCHNPHDPLQFGDQSVNTAPAAPVAVITVPVVTSIPVSSIPATAPLADSNPVVATPVVTPEVSSTPSPAPASVSSAPKVPHTLAGRSNCAMCHKPGGLKPLLDTHDGRTVETCLVCHSN
jgi:hypothetical protein